MLPQLPHLNRSLILPLSQRGEVTTKEGPLSCEVLDQGDMPATENSPKQKETIAMLIDAVCSCLAFKHPEPANPKGSSIRNRIPFS